MRAYMSELDKVKPVIYCGDLNVAHNEIDLKNPGPNRGNAGFSDEERGKMTELLGAGFTDTFRCLYPDTVTYSWWSYRMKARERNAGWRIDYFIISDRLTDKLKEAVIHTEFQGVDLMVSNMNLAGAELEIIDIPNREKLLKTALAPIWEKYDYIFLDCPPSLGLITLNALTASDTFLVPIQCEYYALEGLSQLMATARNIKRLYNPYLELEGVLLTMYDGRLNLTQQVVDEVKKFFPKKVYSTTIPRNVRLSEAPSFGQPIIYFDKRSKGAEAYSDFADEFLSKQDRR
jgi:chromosome partitioning protein